MNIDEEVSRRTANYHPSVWGDYFLDYSSKSSTEIDRQDEADYGRLKEEVRHMIIKTPHNHSSKLELIDAIQRLGLAYNFNIEIEESLREIYNNVDENDNDLHLVALRFRLLRQQGFRVSPSIFKKLKDQEGNFKECLGRDLRGLMSLYEASHFRVHEEDILEEPLTFTTSYLELLLPTMNDSTKENSLYQTLRNPIRKILTWVAARLYIPTYEKEESHNELLLKFAKLNFNILQKMHQKELCELTKWWKNLEVEKRFPYARDRLVELYFWALGVYFEPKYRLARKIVVKVIALTSILDDTYDGFGTLDELTLFTDAIQRMDISALDGLPSCMKYLYEALIDTYSKLEEELSKEGKKHLVTYVKTEIQKISRAYYGEVKWFNNGYVPRIGEYMEVASVSSGYMLLSTTSIVGMGELATNANLDWMSNEPLIVRASCVINRLMSDIVAHEFEQQRGHVASIVECYMNEKGISEEKAVNELKKQVTNAWKDINNECLNPTDDVPMAVLERVVNFARVIHMLYTAKDWYTNSSKEMKELVTLILVDPVTM